jgi:DNA recombination protein RmuC
MVVWFVVGCVAGALVAWLVVNGHAQGVHAELVGIRKLAEEKEQSLANKEEELRAEREANKVAGEELAGMRAKLEATGEKIQTLMDVEHNLKTSFEALAASALDANSGRFMALAKAELEKLQGNAVNQLTEKETAIKTLLQPVQTSLEKLEAGTAALELKRENAYASMLTEIGNIREVHELLRGETNQLVSALRDSGTRGAWGGLQLKRCIEFAGMVQYCSFKLEKFVRLESGESQRPDCVLYLPNNRTIIVDAKTPMDAFLQAIETSDPEERKRQLLRHAGQVRAHLDVLETKAYWKQFPDSPDFVICFLPKEALFSAALEADPTLIEYGNGKVILSTPTTLIALLKAIAFGWNQAENAKNAKVISDAALAVYGKLAGMYEDFIDLGNRLKAAGGCYDDIVTRIDGRGGVFSIARKLRELGIGEKDLEDGKKGEIKAIGLTLRPMESEDWQPGLALAADAEDPTE